MKSHDLDKDASGGLSTFPRAAPRRPTPRGAAGGNVGNHPTPGLRVPVPSSPGLPLTVDGRVDRDEVNEWRVKAGLSVPELLTLTGYTRRTWERWRYVGAPHWVAVLLRLKAGFLDELGWPGWRIRRGRLVSDQWPYEIGPGDLYAWWYERQKLR